MFRLALMCTEVPVHATWLTYGGDGGREWERPPLVWGQGWSLGMLHVDVKTKHAPAFGFQDLARQVNSSTMLILIIRFV